ncbi:MAG: hypothetical protein ACI8Y6_000503 [Brevundimonas sp.]|jgi:hypothetical protein
MAAPPKQVITGQAILQRGGEQASFRQGAPEEIVSDEGKMLGHGSTVIGPEFALGSTIEDDGRHRIGDLGRSRSRGRTGGFRSPSLL